jgi:hypothetical protein
MKYANPGEKWQFLSKNRLSLGGSLFFVGLGADVLAPAPRFMRIAGYGT